MKTKTIQWTKVYPRWAREVIVWTLYFDILRLKGPNCSNFIQTAIDRCFFMSEPTFAQSNLLKWHIYCTTLNQTINKIQIYEFYFGRIVSPRRTWGHEIMKKLWNPVDYIFMDSIQVGKVLLRHHGCAKYHTRKIICPWFITLKFNDFLNDFNSNGKEQMSVKMAFWSFKWQNGIVGNDNLIINGSGSHKNRWTTPKNHVHVSHWTFLQILNNLFQDTTKYNCFSLGYDSCEELDTWTKKKIILIFHTAQCFIIWPHNFLAKKRINCF